MLCVEACLPLLFANSSHEQRLLVSAGRLYAMELGLKIPVKERTKATNALLLSLMNQLERVRFV